MLKEKTKNQKLREKYLIPSYENLVMNGGGPVTFHYTVDKIDKRGNIKKVSVCKRVINISEHALKNRTFGDFMILLVTMQSDFGADYFTL